MLKSIIVCVAFLLTFNTHAEILNRKLLENFIELQPTEAKKWKKAVWSEITLDQKVNTNLFLPYNEDIPAFDHSADEVDPTLYESKKSAIYWNLYTIITSQFIEGNVMLYAPFNPDWQSESDQGYLQFPISSENYGNSKEGNYQTDSTYRYAIKSEFLGYELLDPYASPLMSWEYPDEDSVILGEDGFYEAVYPPSDFVWFQDKDIIKYKVKETWLMDKNGHVIDKVIDAIAPVIVGKDFEGNEIGERTLFWVEFTALKKELDLHYTHLNRYKKEEIISFSTFFERREFYADLLPDIKSNIKAAR